MIDLSPRHIFVDNALRYYILFSASILGIAGLAGFFILSPIMQIYGRKAVHIFKNVLMAVGWIIFYFSESLTGLFIARTIHGIALGGIFINMIIIGEYTSPGRRGYFTAMQKIAISLGTLMCHLMALCYTWREIVVATVLMPIISIILTFIWTESPYFLAMKGRYDECERSFHWLNGTSTREVELADLIQEQKKHNEEKKLQANINGMIHILKQLRQRCFIKSFVIVALLCITMDLSGRNYFKAYAIQIMMELLETRSIAIYVSVGSDVLVLAALVLSCLAVKYFRRRLLLLSFGTLTITFLFSISLLLYLKSHNIVYVWPWLTSGLILAMNFIVHVGVSPVCFIVMGEIFPLELKGLGCCMSGIAFTTSYGVVLKVTPVLMASIGIEGTYLVYGIGILICLMILYFILPETKDKPLLDIERNLKGIQKSDVTESLLKAAPL